MGSRGQLPSERREFRASLCRDWLRNRLRRGATRTIYSRKLPKPLPRDLIYELLPGTMSKLPALLQRKRFSATLLARLNHDEDSPLKGLVRTPTNPKGDKGQLDSSDDRAQSERWGSLCL